MRKRRYIYPHTRCEICGGEDCGGTALSNLRLSFGYGSLYDGERVELTICGDCADKLYNFITDNRSERKIYAKTNRVASE